MDRFELRRLEKAAREKDKRHLIDWAKQYEDQIEANLRKEYEKVYQEEIQNSIDNFIVALSYTIVYTEEWKFDPNNLAGFLEDLFVTVDMYRTGESSPDQYREDLAKHGVIIDKADYNKIYKEKQARLDSLIEKYLNLIEETEKVKEEYHNKLDSLNSNKNIV